MVCKRLVLSVLCLIIAATTFLGAQNPQERGAKPKTRLEVRLESLEQKVLIQRFEIDQLKKELLARDEEIHALSQMIEGEPAVSPKEPQQNDDEFQAENDLCHSIHFVRSLGAGSAIKPVRRTSSRYRY